MARKKKYYITEMYRWGEGNNHAYALGVFSTKTKATKAGLKEQDYRGDKYMPTVTEFDLDSDARRDDSHLGKTVVPLKRSPCWD